MSALALCPVCGKTLTARSDDRLPRHWPTRRHRLAGEPRCDGSLMATRNWAVVNGVRHRRAPHA